MTRTTSLGETVATNLRAEMAAQKRTAKELADVLGVGHRAALRRVHGDVPLSLAELHASAAWLSVEVADLMKNRNAVAA